MTAFKVNTNKLLVVNGAPKIKVSEATITTEITPTPTPTITVTPTNSVTPTNTVTPTATPRDPTVPSNVTVLAQSDLDDCDNSITVSWTAPSDTGGLTIGYYYVETSINSGSSWTGGAAIGPFGSPDTSVTYTDPPNYSFIYRVRAQYTNGEYSGYSDPSAPVSPIELGLLAPFLVGSVNGAYDPETGRGNGVGDGLVHLQWAPSSACAAGVGYISRHRIEYSSNSGASWTVFAADSSEADGSGTPKITVTGLTNGTTYTFRVAGVADHPSGGTYVGAYGLSGSWTPTA